MSLEKYRDELIFRRMARRVIDSTPNRVDLKQMHDLLKAVELQDLNHRQRLQVESGFPPMSVSSRDEKS